MPLKSALDLLDECDNFPYYTHSLSESNSINTTAPTVPTTQPYCLFLHHSTLLGYITSWVFSRITWDPNIWSVNPTTRSVSLKGHNVEERSKAMAGVLDRLRQEKIFEVLDGWRGELYPVYGEGKELVLEMERSATPLFGVVSYGVHMTAFVRDDGVGLAQGGAARGMKIWAPRRAMTKQTYPGMMDNTVGGGLTTGEKVFDCLVREASEEASLPEDIVRENARACGTVTYFYVRDGRAGGETGLCQPECQYVYDLELPPTVVPVPDDNEAEDFRLLTVAEVKDALAEGKFKPNCSLVLLDFFVRHGILTPENEPDYVEIVSRLHRRLEFPTP